MKEYLIRVHFDSYVDVKVNAENDDDAKRIAESESLNRELCPRFPSATGFDFIESKDVKLTIKEQIDNLWNEIIEKYGYTNCTFDLDSNEEIECNVMEDAFFEAGTLYADCVSVEDDTFNVYTSNCNSKYYDKEVSECDIDLESRLRVLKAILPKFEEEFGE